MTCKQRYPGCTICGCDPVGGLYECSSNEGEFAEHYWEPAIFAGTQISLTNDEASFEFRHFGSFLVSETKTCSLPDCELYDVLSDGRLSCNQCRSPGFYVISADPAGPYPTAPTRTYIPKAVYKFTLNDYSQCVVDCSEIEGGLYVNDDSDPSDLQCKCKDGYHMNADGEC